MRKKWDERTKLQLGKLIQNQLDMRVKLNDAVTRAAEILQAPRSTCMNYWQKELKFLDYTQDSALLEATVRSSPATDSQIDDSDQYEEMHDSGSTLATLIRRLKDNEEKVRDIYHKTGLLLNDYAALTRELAAALEVQQPAVQDEMPQPFSLKRALDFDDLSKGDIVRVHYHIWQDYYYITAVVNSTAYGYKLNKNLRIRRKSKEKLISKDMLQFGKIIRRDVSMEDVSASE